MNEATRCIVCAAEIVGTRRRLCSRECAKIRDRERSRERYNKNQTEIARRRAHLRALKKQPLHCVVCGTELPARRSKLCSDECVRQRRAMQALEWSRRHPEKNRAKAAQWHLANPIRSAANKAAWQRRNYAEKVAAKNAKWKAANRHVLREQQHRRRALQREAYVEPVVRTEIFERDRWKCVLCGRKLDPNTAYPASDFPTIDHIIPLAVGGTHEPQNVQAACLRCNRAKSYTGTGDQLLLFG